MIFFLNLQKRIDYSFDSIKLLGSYCRGSGIFIGKLRRLLSCSSAETLRLAVLASLGFVSSIFIPGSFECIFYLV
jgi:hypothetical protein